MNDLINQKIKEIEEICEKYDVKSLHVFGSATNEEFTDKSDIDLIVSFKEIPIEKYSDNYFHLHDQFQEIFNRKIDLITDKSIKNPYFKKEVEKTKNLIYE
ncbi:MAG: nucleotidyltransferase domain-containing protein, partial [Candidatus Moranbacteria bacterium]|nr:nucleotidyltransferase domain-containing protein [Candidatus Moranbacteria bacterium]